MANQNYSEALRFLEEAECALDQADSCMERAIQVRVTRFPASYASAGDLRKHVAGLIVELKSQIESVSTEVSA